MTTSNQTKKLPLNPSLAQLRRQAKELLKSARSGDESAKARIASQLERLARETSFSLSLSQLALAREYGFESWPKLKAFVETQGMTFEQKVGHFVDAAFTGRLWFANHLLQSEPSLATFHFGLMCLAGNLEAVKKALSLDPKAAVTPVGKRHWLPLVYVTHSHFHREGEEKKNALLEIARLLLQNGADPNSTYTVKNQDGNEDGPIPVLYGPCGQTNFPELAELLLEAGAKPDEKESLYHSTEFADGRCTRLLLKHGVKPGAWGVLHHQLDRDDLNGVRILLEAGADPNASYENLGTALHHAIVRGRGAPFVTLLLEFGADPMKKNPFGRNAVDTARRYGNLGALEALKARPEGDHMSNAELFLAACARADERRARELHYANPLLLSQLQEQDKALLVELAELGRLDAVRLMLELGFDVNQRGEWGTVVQAAAWHAQTEVVRLLISKGANIELLNRYEGTALGTALYATQFWKCQDDRYNAVVELLLEAGAEIKPWHLTMGNEAVTELVKSYAE